MCFEKNPLLPSGTPTELHLYSHETSKESREITLQYAH